MRIFLSLLILIFSFQSWTKADDIRNFEIEGISIGDSGLKIFSIKDLNNKSYLYKSKKYASATKYASNSNYDVIQIEFKDDGNYIIESLIGRIEYYNDFDECKKLEKEILIDLKKIFLENSKYTNHGITSHQADPTGESIGSLHSFVMNDNSGWIMLECMNWSQKLTKKNGWTDALKLTIVDREFGEWLNTSAY